MDEYQWIGDILVLLLIGYVIRLAYSSAPSNGIRALRRNSRIKREERRYNTYLLAGQVLESGDSVFSENGRYRLIQQSDGNLCLYEEGEHRWCSRVTQPGPVFTIMQKDGDLVQYSGTPRNPGASLWNTYTSSPWWEYFEKRGITQVLLVADSGAVSIVAIERGNYGDQRKILEETKRIV